MPTKKVFGTSILFISTAFFSTPSTAETSQDQYERCKIMANTLAEAHAEIRHSNRNALESKKIERYLKDEELLENYLSLHESNSKSKDQDALAEEILNSAFSETRLKELSTLPRKEAKHKMSQIIIENLGKTYESQCEKALKAAEKYLDEADKNFVEGYFLNTRCGFFGDARGYKFERRGRKFFARLYNFKCDSNGTPLKQGSTSDMKLVFNEKTGRFIDKRIYSEFYFDKKSKTLHQHVTEEGLGKLIMELKNKNDKDTKETYNFLKNGVMHKNPNEKESSLFD